MDPAQIQNFTDALNQLGASLRGNASSVGQSMARLRTEMQRGTGSVQANAAALQRLISDYESLDDAVKQSTAGQNMLADQTRMAGQLLRETTGQLSAGLLKGGIAEAVDYVSKQLYTSVSNYQQGVSGMQAAFNNQNAALESEIKILERLSSGATLTAEALMLIPSPIARLGAIAAGAVAGVSEFVSFLRGKQLEAFKVFQKEMVITGQTFDIMTKSGVLFQSGFADVRATAGVLQLNLDELAKTVNQNKQELLGFGGSVTGGVRRLVKIGDAFTRLAAQGQDLRKELEYAGYSQQEQTDGMIDYMDMLNRTGRLRGMTDEQVAKEGAEYLKVAKALTSYTGEEAKSAQKRAQEASEQLAVQAKLRKSQDPKAMEKFQTLVKTMPGDMTKALSQMVATGGSVIDKDLNILFAQSPTRKRAIDEAYADLSSGLYTQEELFARQEERMKRYGPMLEEEALAMGDNIGLVTQISGKYADVTAMGQNQIKEAQKAQASLIDELGTTSAQMKKLKEQGVDPLRDSAISASRVMREDLPGFIRAAGNAMNDYAQKTFAKEGIEGMAKAVREANIQAIKIMQEGSNIVSNRATSPILGAGGRVSEAISGAVNYLLDATKQLSTASGNLSNVTGKLDRIFPKAKGGVVSDPAVAAIAEKGPEAVVPLPDGKTIPVSLQLPNASRMLETVAAGQAQKSTEDINKILDLLSSSLTGLTNQVTASNQSTDSKLSELINTMRDKSILEDMKRYAEETADNTRIMARELG